MAINYSEGKGSSPGQSVWWGMWCVQTKERKRGRVSGTLRHLELTPNLIGLKPDFSIQIKLWFTTIV